MHQQSWQSWMGSATYLKFRHSTLSRVTVFQFIIFSYLRFFHIWSITWLLEPADNWDYFLYSFDCLVHLCVCMFLAPALSLEKAVIISSSIISIILILLTYARISSCLIMIVCLIFIFASFIIFYTAILNTRQDKGKFFSLEHWP